VIDSSPSCIPLCSISSANQRSTHDHFMYSGKCLPIAGEIVETSSIPFSVHRTPIQSLLLPTNTLNQLHTPWNHHVGVAKLYNKVSIPPRKVEPLMTISVRAIMSSSLWSKAPEMVSSTAQKSVSTIILLN
jgi:hypothetical protein